MIQFWLLFGVPFTLCLAATAILWVAGCFELDEVESWSDCPLIGTKMICRLCPEFVVEKGLLEDGTKFYTSYCRIAHKR